MFQLLFSTEIIVSIVVAFVVLVVGTFVLASNVRIRANIIFFLMTLSAVLWIVTVLYRFNVDDALTALFYARLTFGSAGLLALCFYYFTYYFPEKNLYRLYHIPVLIVGSLFSAIFFSPLTVLDLQIVGGEQIDTYGFGYYMFVVYFPLVVMYSIYNLVSKYRSLGDEKKAQVQYMLVGVALSFILGFTINVVVTLFTGTTTVARYGPLTSTIFLVMTGVAIFRHHLFNVKIIATELFVFALWIFILVRTLLSENSGEVFLNGALLMLTLVVGVLLIRSVIREVEQREKIESLAKDLEETNERQEKLLHFVGHEVKGYLTRGEYAFSEMVDGDFGTLPQESQVLATTALAEMRKGVAAVTDILKAANLKRGTVTYNLKPIDFKEFLKEEIIKTKALADEKGLAFEVSMDEKEVYRVNLDRVQFGEHVIRNLIDNSVKYTPKGSIIVRLARAGDKALFSIKDSGVGITDEDKAHLFTEGGHGKDSMKVNVHSTGYGLYIAKGIVEAHGGKIWVESEGTEKGSTFFVELPLATAPVV